MVCPLCGRHTNGIALLGASADRTMNELHKDRGERQDGYKEYGYNEIPDQQPCDDCMGILNNKGTILIGEDIGQSLRLASEQVDMLVGKVMDAKNRILDFNAMRGRVIRFPRAFWYMDGENIRLRDPEEWTV